MESNNIEFDFINVKKTPIEKNQLKEITSYLGMDTVFNMRGPTFRKMKLDYNNLNDTKKLDLLYENQSMIKRPLLEKDNRYHVGYDEEKILKFVRS